VRRVRQHGDLYRGGFLRHRRQPGRQPQPFPELCQHLAIEPDADEHTIGEPDAGTISELLGALCRGIELSGGDPGSVPPPAARGIAALVVANTSLLIAVLVYMGWAYEDAFLGYFHLSPLDLDVGVVEYMLRSLSLFSPDLVVAAVVVVAVTAVRAWGLGRTTFARHVEGKVTARISALPVLRRLVSAGNAEQPHSGRVLLISTGAAITVTALIMAWAASYILISTYLVLALLGGGPLLLTWPTRAERHGRFPYSLAVVVTAVCALWATALYAHSIGIRNAQAFVRDLPSGTAVVVYSAQRLAMAGSPGVTVQQLLPGSLYHYEYQGFRLLLMRSGTYYLVPVGWNPRQDHTYVFDESDQIRITLLSGVVRSDS